MIELRLTLDWSSGWSPDFGQPLGRLLIVAPVNGEAYVAVGLLVLLVGVLTVLASWYDTDNSTVS